MNPRTPGDGVSVSALGRLYARLAMWQGLILERLRYYSHQASSMARLDICVTWCKGMIRQGCIKLQEFVNGGLEHKALAERIQQLEGQLQQLLREKEELKKKEEQFAEPQVQTKSLQCSHCQCHMGDTITGQGTTLPSASPPPLLPPPPPPPPPPPISMSYIRFNIVKRKALAGSNGCKEKEQWSRPMVTAEDLQKVKLRPSEERLCPAETAQGDTPQRGGDLRQLALRKTQSAVILRDVGNIVPIQADEVARQKQSLKKTFVERSPGGTPLRDGKRRHESGQGLTPMMNRALQRQCQGLAAMMNTAVQLRFQTQSESSDLDSPGPFSNPDGNRLTSGAIVSSPLTLPLSR